MTDTKNRIGGRLYVALRLLARMLLKIGLNAREFVELAKMAYADAAGEMYGSETRSASMAEVARRTGLTRAEVRRLRERIAAQPPHFFEFGQTIESEVLHRWHTDPDFLDHIGKPRALTLPNGPDSFADLVRICDREADASAIFIRLQEGDHISSVDDLSYVPMRRNYLTPPSAYGLPNILHMSIVGICKTIEHNFSRTEPPGWIQRTVYSDQLSPASMPVIRHAVRSRARSFSEDVDDLFAAHSSEPLKSDASSDPNDFKAGIGVFYFEDS